MSKGLWLADVVLGLGELNWIKSGRPSGRCTNLRMLFDDSVQIFLSVCVYNGQFSSSQSPLLYFYIVLLGRNFWPTECLSPLTGDGNTGVSEKCHRMTIG